jgi:long-chain fatty acid transport protein
LGTVQWSNWSRFKGLTLAIPVGDLKTAANWDDGWFFSIGGEYDYSPNLTLRSGIAYEMSPIDDASKRLVQIPDNNRIWLSVGASYAWSEAMTIDLAYSHIFIEDGGVDLYTTSTPVMPGGVGPFTGNVQASVDLFSVGLRTKW